MENTVDKGALQATVYGVARVDRTEDGAQTGMLSQGKLEVSKQEIARVSIHI